MYPLSSYDPNNQPLFHVKGYPVRLAVLLVVIHVTALIVTSIGGAAFSRWLGLGIAKLPGSEVMWPDFWQWGTYILNHSPSVWFLIDMLFLGIFGHQLEQMMGRKFLLRLYLCLIALPALLVLAAALIRPEGIYVLTGTRHAHFSLFLAIAFLHPNAPCFCSIPALKLKWVAAALFAIHSLGYIASRDFLNFAILFSCAAFTYFLMRRYGLTPRFERVAEAFAAALPSSRNKADKPKRLPYEPKVVARPQISPDRAPVAKIDAILAKISESGIDSLDEWERRELERASRELKRQDD